MSYLAEFHIDGLGRCSQRLPMEEIRREFCFPVFTDIKEGAELDMSAPVVAKQLVFRLWRYSASMEPVVVVYRLSDVYSARDD